MYCCDELFMHSLKCYFGIHLPRCCATRAINTKITLSWAHKQFTTRVLTLFSMYSTRSPLHGWFQFQKKSNSMAITVNCIQYQLCDHYKKLHMDKPLCCPGMWKNMQQLDCQRLKWSKEFTPNFDYKWNTDCFIPLLWIQALCHEYVIP